MSTKEINVLVLAYMGDTIYERPLAFSFEI